MQECTFVVRRTNRSDELQHWKYLKKEKKNGKWRYYYDKDALAKDAKDKFNSIYNDPNNIYDVSARNYNKKMELIKNSKEWQDIVKREDPEYVQKNKDGSKTYYLDDYLVKKKHPELDIISDLGAGRKISLNKITTKSFIAGTKDYIKAARNVVGIVAVALTEKFKLSQGTYNDEIKTVKQTAKDTYKTAKTNYNTTKNSAKDVYSKTTNAANTTYSNSSREREELANTINLGAQYVSHLLRNY